MPYISGQVADFLGGSLGIAAILLVAGWLALRWQQDRHRFRLMQTALEKGITRFPDSPPYWLVSMRQGLTMLALGIALAAVGGGAFWLGKQTPMPDMAKIFTGPQQFGPEDAPDRRPVPRRDDEYSADGPDRRPDRRPEPPGPGRRPPVMNPEMERWHQAQAQQTVGLVSAGIGVILLFVGVIRVVFAQAERQYSTGHSTQESNF
jgi:hypothetical protein